MSDKIYHIYAKNECILHSLSENEFRKTWNMLSILNTNYEELSYEELTLNEGEYLKCSH
jgi:hypothetical protein